MALSFWQLASVVLEEGKESFTANFCQKCCNESLKAKGELWRKRRIVKTLEMMGQEQHVREMWEYFCTRVKRVSRGGRRRKASRNTGSVAAGLANQRVLGTS